MTNSEALLNALAIIAIGFAIASTAAAGYIWHLYLSADNPEPRSGLLRVLATTSTVADVAALWFGFTAVRRLLGSPPLPVETALISVAFFFALEALPLVKVAYLFSLRNRD